MTQAELEFRAYATCMQWDAAAVLVATHAIRRAVAEEREACALLVDGWHNDFDSTPCCGLAVERMLGRVVDGIRERGP